MKYKTLYSYKVSLNLAGDPVREKAELVVEKVSGVLLNHMNYGLDKGRIVWVGAVYTKPQDDDGIFRSLEHVLNTGRISLDKIK